MSLKRRVSGAIRSIAGVGSMILPITGLPFLGQQVLRGITGSRRANQSSEAIAAASLAQQQAEMQALSDKAMTRYKTGEIDPGTKAAIDRSKEIRKAQLRERMGMAGTGTGSSALELARIPEQMSVQDIDQARDQEFSKAMQSIGMSDAAISALTQIHASERQATAQSFMQTMNILGNMTALVTSGA